MKHSIDWYMGLMDELDEEFQPLVDMFEYIDDMVLPRWSLPQEFTNVIKDVMSVVDTAPSDAIKSASVAFSRNIPIFSVMPFRANKDEYNRAQGLEDNLRYQFKRSNKRGNGSVMYDMAESSLRYDTIAVRTDDLAHILPKNKKNWTPLQRQAWAHGRFIHTAYNPKKVRYMYSRLGLTFVGCTETLRVTDAIAHWELYANNETDEGKQVAQGLADLRDAIDERSKDFNLSDMYVAQTYTIDYDKICIYGSLSDRDGNAITRKNSDETYDFVFADQENAYGFLNWSVRVAGARLEDRIEYRVNPILAPLYWSKSWDKINLFKSVVFSEPFRRARSPRGIAMTQDGEGAVVDYKNGADVNLRTGEDYKPFVPITLDQGAIAVIGALEAAMNRTTGSSVLGDTTKIDSRTPFATFAAMVKVALSRLDKQNETIADTVNDIACNMLYWVHKTDVPLTAYVENTTKYRSGSTMERGRAIETGKYDFDLNDLGISTKVMPATPTDRMEQLNMAILLSEKLNMPSSELLQEMGYDNVGLSYQLWVDEYLKKAETQAEAAKIMAKAQTSGQLEAQNEAQAAMQAQQAAQQPPPAPAGGGAEAALGADGGVSNAAFGATGGSPGFNTAAGGQSATAAAPTMTREAITGQAQNGGGMV
jgi:hypothetical protein